MPNAWKGLDVDINDLLIVIGQWGNEDSIADINNDGTVNVDDMLFVIGSWGACP